MEFYGVLSIAVLSFFWYDGSLFEKSMRQMNRGEKRGFFGGCFLVLEMFRVYFLRKTKIAFLSFTILFLGVFLIGETVIPVRNAKAFDFPVAQSKDFSLCDLERELHFFGLPDNAAPESRECSIERDLFVLASKPKKDELTDDSQNRELEEEIVSLTTGYPIETMAPAISKFDREIAALLVGIAKKESNWGRRVPRATDGADCFNYWGFKGAGERGVAMGHGCFGTPEEAVEKVGNRLAELVALRETSDPARMTVWKCGSSCATHSPKSVQKWISDVDQYYQIIASR